MTLNKQQKDTLKQRFPGVNDDDLTGSTSTEIANAIAARTGEDATQVEQQVKQVTNEA
jgi:hypothetical protein